MTKRESRADHGSGVEYARDLRLDGLDYEHIRSGAGYGGGPDAVMLAAIWGNNPGDLLAQEMAEWMEKQHVVTTAPVAEHHDRVVACTSQAANPFRTEK